MFVLPRSGSGVAPDESVRPARQRPYRSGAGCGDRFGGCRPADIERSRGAAAVRDCGVGRDRTHGARGHQLRPGGRGPRRGAALPRAGRAGRAVPGLGDTAARAALPARGHGGPTAGRAASAGPSGDRRVGRPQCRPGAGRRRPGAIGAAAAGAASRRPHAGGAARRRRRPGADRHRHRPGGRGVRADRAGREARRLRGARWHPRRLPADRGTPAAGGVLGRRGRGDPVFQGRRPALARGGRARVVGAAVPRTAPHRRRPGARRTAADPASGAVRTARPDQPRRGGRGHGGAGAGAGRPPHA